MEIHSDLRSPRSIRTLPPQKTTSLNGTFNHFNRRVFQTDSKSGSHRTSVVSPLNNDANTAKNGSLLPQTQDSERISHRASTGVLLQSTKTSNQTPQPGCRASTGGLTYLKRTDKRNTYHHILSGDLKIRLQARELQLKSNQELQKKDQCGRCGGQIRKQYFQCLNCPSFNLCADCGDEASQIIGKISPEEARTLYYGTRTFPTKFRPPSPLDLPSKLFVKEHRFIRISNPREILIFTDGVCLQNSKSGPVAGWAFVYRPSAYTKDGILTHAGTISGRLEARGPTGQFYNATSNRAELRAAIAALQFMDWSRDCNRGWRSVVIATDSDYLTLSVTKYIPDWEDSKWKLQGDIDVNNKDLWQLLLQEVRKYHSEGVKVAFWRIPRHCNARAHEFAKKATGRGYKERDVTVKFQPDGPVKVRVTPFVLREDDDEKLKLLQKS